MDQVPKLTRCDSLPILSNKVGINVSKRIQTLMNQLNSPEFENINKASPLVTSLRKKSPVKNLVQRFENTNKQEKRKEEEEIDNDQAFTPVVFFREEIPPWIPQAAEVKRQESINLEPTISAQEYTEAKPVPLPKYLKQETPMLDLLSSSCPTAFQIGSTDTIKSIRMKNTYVKFQEWIKTKNQELEDQVKLTDGPQKIVKIKALNIEPQNATFDLSENVEDNNFEDVSLSDCYDPITKYNGHDTKTLKRSQRALSNLHLNEYTEAQNSKSDELKALASSIDKIFNQEPFEVKTTETVEEDYIEHFKNDLTAALKRMASQSEGNTFSIPTKQNHEIDKQELAEMDKLSPVSSPVSKIKKIFKRKTLEDKEIGGLVTPPSSLTNKPGFWKRISSSFKVSSKSNLYHSNHDFDF